MSAENEKLAARHLRMLQCVAGMMIPADSQRALPAADDPQIFADVIATLGRDQARVEQALSLLAASTLQSGGELPFEARPPQARREIIEAFRREHPGRVAVLEEVIVRCYYRDDRVMHAIGMEPRAPYPKGFEVEQGDWQLLEPVRLRGSIYREA